MRKPIVIFNCAFVVAVLACFTLAFAQTAPTADDALPTANGNALIHPIGHASLQIAWNGKKILVDPAPSGGGLQQWRAVRVGVDSGQCLRSASSQVVLVRL